MLFVVATHTIKTNKTKKKQNGLDIVNFFS